MNDLLKSFNYFNKAISQTLHRQRKIAVKFYSRQERIEVRVVHE